MQENQGFQHLDVLNYIAVSYTHLDVYKRQIQNGLTMAIANPSQELLMHAVYAADLLCNKPDSDLRYIERVSQNKISVVDGEVDADVAKKAVKKTDTGVADTEGKDALFTAVVKGRKEKVLELVKEKIANGEDAQGVIDQSLIPAINHVGELFDKQIYYLPQLISSAEAMEGGIDLLEPELAKNRSAKSLGTVVIATVAVSYTHLDVYKRQQ